MRNRLGLLLLAVLAAACNKAPQRPNIVLISIDTLRADRLGTYGYVRDTSPEIDALAADAVVWERALAPMSQTLPSHIALLTSTHPETNQVRRNQNVFRSTTSGIRTLAELLSERGYSTAGFVSATPLKSASGVNAGFETWGQPERRQLSAAETTDRALAWLEGEAGGAAEPFFLFVHFYDPHTIRLPHPEFNKQMPADDPALDGYLRDRHFPMDRDALHEANALYDGEVRYTSLHVGRLLAELKERGLYQDAVVILVSDHGEGIGQHDRGNHGMNWEEQLHVPLLVRFPEAMGLNGQRREGLASLLDVVPTLVGVFGFDLNEDERRQFQGFDLLGESDDRRYVLSLREIPNNAKKEPGRGWALSTREWKYFMHTHEPDRLYRRATDPYEIDNVLDEHPEVASRLKQAIDDLLDEHKKRSEGSEATEIRDPELLDELRGLGYLD